MINNAFPLLAFAFLFFCNCTNPNTASDSPAVAYELPKCVADKQIVKHLAFTLSYNEEHEQANWVAYELTKDHLNGGVKRTNKFIVDPFVITGSATEADYKGSGYDRGHLAPAGDMTWDATAMAESFYYSNMSPQAPGFNRGIWKNLEEQVRNWAAEYGMLYIATGPVLSKNLSVIGPEKVSIPEYYYKAVLDYQPPDAKAIGFIMKNESSSMPLSKFAVSIDSLEKFTGIDFFYQLPDKEEKQIEANLSLSKWDFNVSTTTYIKNKTTEDKDQKLRLATAVQCSATTKAGARCKRMTKSPNGKCYQHGGN